MRLIDADELIRKINNDNNFAKYIPSGIDERLVNGYYKGYVEGEITLISTAYDIDKVVVELEELKNKDVCDYLDCDICLYNEKCGVETDQSDNLKWDKAIEIVKQCGVSDDVCEWHCDVYGRWHTKCHRLADNDPLEYTFCPYCGKKIKELK